MFSAPRIFETSNFLQMAQPTQLMASSAASPAAPFEAFSAGALQGAPWVPQVSSEGAASSPERTTTPPQGAPGSPQDLSAPTFAWDEPWKSTGAAAVVRCLCI